MTELRQRLTTELARRYPSLQRQDNLVLLEKTVALVLGTPRELTWLQAGSATKKEATALGYEGPHWVNHVMKFAKQFYSEFSPTKQINYLNLDEEGMSYSWGERYNIKVAKMVARDGKPLMKDADQYGWVDQSSLAHFRAGKNQCYIAEITSIEEDEWDQFENTFADNSEHLGVQADAQCACGWFRGKIRAEGTLGELVASMRSNI